MNSLFQLNEKGVVELKIKPDYNKIGIFTREQEEEIEKENEAIRRSLIVPEEKLRIPFTI